MLRNRRSRCLPSVGHLFQDHSRTIMTFCLQNCLQCYEMAFFIGYQVEGCFCPSKSRNLPYVPWQVNSSIVRYFTKGTSVTRSPVITKTGWLKCQWCGASPPPDDSPLLGKSRTNMGDLNLLTQLSTCFVLFCDWRIGTHQFSLHTLCSWFLLQLEVIAVSPIPTLPFGTWPESDCKNDLCAATRPCHALAEKSLDRWTWFRVCHFYDLLFGWAARAQHCQCFQCA